MFGQKFIWQGWHFCSYAKNFLEEQLDEEQRLAGNHKNVYNSKQLKTAEGTFDLSTPRDRPGEFEPQIVQKRETILAESLEQKIIGMYGHGMSLRDISAHIKDMYDTDIFLPAHYQPLPIK